MNVTADKTIEWLNTSFKDHKIAEFLFDQVVNLEDTPVSLLDVINSILKDSCGEEIEPVFDRDTGSTTFQYIKHSYK